MPNHKNTVLKIKMIKDIYMSLIRTSLHPLFLLNEKLVNAGS